MSENNMIRTEKKDEETILPNAIKQIQFQLPLFQSWQTNKIEKNKLKEREICFHFLIKKKVGEIKVIKF